MKYAVESHRNELLRKIEHQLTRIADTLEEKNTTAENSDVNERFTNIILGKVRHSCTYCKNKA